MAPFGSLQFCSTFERCARSGSSSLLLFLLFTSVARAQGPIWNWAATLDGGNTEFVRDIAVEPGTGNFYAVGGYRSSISTAASYALPASEGGSQDAFLAKLDPSGNVLWSRAFGSTQEDAALGVSVASNGTVIITGYYSAPIAGIGLTNAGSQDAFIVAYDGTGAFQWARSVTGPQREEGTSIVISGNTVVAYGSFTYNSTNTNGVLATSGLNNNRSYAYLNAYDLTGGVLWSITGVSNDDILSERIATDGTNVYVVGSTKGDALSWRNSLGSSSTTVTTADNEALFCSAIRLGGSVAWSRMINNPDDSDVECNGVAVDCGNVYITGRTNNNSLFPGGIIPTGPGSDDYWFLAALSNSTGSTNWVRTASSSIDQGVTGYDVSVGRNGQIHVAGTLTGTMTTDGGTVIGGGSAYDLLISRFNSDGTAVWHHRATSPDNELGFAIASLGGGRIVVGGEYENGLTLGSSTYPGSNGSNLFTASFTDPDWVNLSNNPARFALPGPFCSSVGPLDLNNYLQAYASETTASSNVTSPTEATGAPNGVGSHFNTTNGWVVLDMRDTVLVGEAVQLVWRSQTTGVQARMLVSTSLDGVNWTTASTYYTTSATYGTVTYPLASNARFIRVQRHSSSTYTSFHLDAVRYYGSTLTGGTWSGGSHVTAAGIFSATAAGSYPVTYTVVLGACTYTYTRSIVVNLGPTGTITGPAALCSGATGTWTLSAPVGTTIAWQRSTNNGALWTTFANDVVSVSGVLGQPTMFRALLSNASCPTPVATNTIETVPGDVQGPTFPPLADIVRRTATGRCDTVVSFATPVATDNCTTCDPGSVTGYTRLGVFQGHAYYMSNATSYWPDAKTTANATGGHLVYITSAAENTWLAAQTSNIEVFIGMSDQATEGTWLWGDGQPVIDAPWAPGHPITWIGYDFGALNVGGNGLWAAVGGILPLPRRHIVEFDCTVWQSAGPSSGSAFPVGNTTVTFSASDLAGNISSRSFDVTVEDVTAPTFTQCPGNLILPLGAGCAARVPNLVALASATDDCSAVVMGQVPEPNDIITTDSLAYIVAKDVYGNTDTCWVQLIVQDQTAPALLSCPADITVNVPLAQLDMVVNYLLPTASDNCAVVWNGQTDGTGLTSGSAFPIGTTQQRWSFRDAAGNISTCSFEVTVLANDAPQLLCPMFAPVVTDAGQCSALVNHTPPVAFDAQDGSLTATLMPPSLPPGPFPIGTSTVTYRVQDLDGNVASCSFTVTVFDGEAPTITCPPSQTLNSATTECSTFVSWPAPIVADNCPSCIPPAALSSYILLGIHDGKQYYLKNDPETYDGAIAAAQSMGYHLLSIGTAEENDFVLASLNAVGVDPVWIGLTDEVAEGTFLWHSGEPLLYQNWVGGEPNNTGEEDAVMMTGAGQWNDVPVGITLPYIVEVPCSGLELYHTGGPTNGSAFPVGTTDVSYTVVDAAGRSADCMFSITVVDSIPPIFSNCPANDTLTLPGHDCTMAYILPTVFSDDGNACDTDTENGYRTEVLLSGALTTLDITGWSNLALPHGTHRFRETHTDDAGNQATCEWTVTVEDVMHPEVLCLLTDSFPLYLDGACSIAFPDLRSYVTATDCNGATIDMWPLPGTVFTGDTLVQMTMVVKDSLGNSVPNNHSIWIHDNTPPSITCPDTLFFPATTSCLGNVLIPGPTSVFDNCGVPSWTVDANNGLWPVGDSTVTYTVTDGRNTSTCATVIRVLDGTPAIPTITASGPTTFCSGGSVTLTSSSASGNLWSNGATTNSITVNTAGTYAVTVTDANGCSSASASISVTLNTPPATPVITASGPTTFCSGGTVTLTSSSASGNLWSNGATTNSITVNTAGSYAVSVTDANGCSSASTSISVVVNTLPATPVITASGPTTFCSGGSVTLTSSSATGNLWSNGATSNSITVNTAGTYAVTVTDANGCSSASASISVVVNTPPATPVITASGPTTFCSGGSVTLTSSSASGNLWSNGATTNSITVNTAGSYAVTATDGNGCSATSATTTVVVNPAPATPVITASGPTTFCSGGSVTLTSSSASGNLWSNGATTNSITVNTAGTYAVTATDGNGCSATSAATTVVVNPALVTPVISASGPTTFCSGGSVTLTSSSAAGNFWSNGATTNSITVNTAGTYAVTVTDANGCSATSAVTTVEVNPTPVSPVITASGPTTFCAGGSVTLTSSSPSGNLWSNGATNNSITVNTAGTYAVTATDGNGCSATSAATTVVVNPTPVSPVITASGPTTFCSGGSVTLTSSSATGNLWSNGATSNSITVNTAGTYEVTVTDANGCSAASATTTVVVNPTPVAPVITASGPTTFCAGGSVTLTSSSTTGNLWSNGATTNSISLNTAGNYAITVTDANGCSATSATTTVVVNPAPVAPVITASGPTTFCSGGSVTLTSSSASGNLWSNGATTNSINVNTGGNYSVTVTDANVCSATSATTTVVVNAAPVAPVITASGPTTFCSGGSVTLTSSSAAGNLWSNGATTNSINVNTGGNYSVTVTDANGCSATSATTTVVVNPAPVVPVITASGPTTFCAGGSVTLTSSSASGNLWSNGATTQDITVSAAGNYTVAIENVSGCSATSTTTSITVNPLPTPVVTADGPTTFCTGGSVNLVSSSSSGNVWTTGATTPTISVMTSGSYAVSVTDINGCSATSSAVPVQVDIPPQPVIAPIPVLCSSGGPIELFGTPSSGTWSGPGVIGASFSPGAAGPGNHTITYTVGQPGCINTATNNIQVNEQFIAPPFSYPGSPFCTSGSVVPPPVFTIAPNPGGSFTNTGLAAFNSATGQFNAGATSPGTYAVTYTSAANGVCPSMSIITMVQVNTSVWAGNDATLELCGTASPVPLFGSLTGANAGGTWTSPLGVVHTGVYDPAVDGSGTYRYTVTGPVGCGSDTAVVVVSETPAPNGGTLVGDADHCGTSNAGTLLLSGHTGNLHWQKRINGGPWTDFANATNSYTYSNLPVGIYDYRVVLDAPGCPQAMSNSVTVRVSRPPNAGTANPIFICQGTSFTLDVLVTSEDVSGTWTDVNGAVVSGTVAPFATTAYTYTVPSNGSCASDARTVQVTVIQPPNAGSNGSISVCSTDPALNLFDALNGTPSTGGTWTGPSPITGGLYDAMSMVPGTYTYTVNGQIPCPSAQSAVVVSETTATSNTTTISACEPLTWVVNGQTYTESGTYTHVDGCHTDTLVLTITPSTSNTTTISACDTYTWSVNGATYTQSGTYTDVDDCHTETLVLTIVSSTNNTTTVSACDTYTWSVNGVTYTESGTYTDMNGCATETLVLTITPSTNNSTTTSACDTYTWNVNGTTYTQSGTYTDVDGCHTETLVLTIVSSTNNTTTVSACDTYTWSVNGVTYTESGTYTDMNGCATETLVLTITPSTNNTTTISACDTYTWSVNGATYTQSGTYTDVDGCHTETLVLTITPSTSNTTTISACDIYTWSVNGATYTQSGTYTDVDDCHTETLVLTIVSSTNNTTTVSACDTYTWNISGLTYTESGTYTSVSGCGTQTLVLTITPSTNNTTTISACDTYTWSVNGATYTQSGTYTDVNDCHTETLVLTITPSTNNTTTISACDSYTWSVNGATYTQSGTYTDVDGCHTETLVLTIVSSTNNTTTVSACDTYTWNISGLTYTESGTYTSVSGCGTQTLVLTITPSTSNTTTISACDTYTWSVNGATYTQSGTYTDVDGCHTETLVLSITPSTNNTTTISACDTYTWSVNGATYTQSGTYTDVDGCHTETLVLTITPSTNNTATISACDTYTWSVNGATYTQSGTYTDVDDCHTETLVLTITPSTNNTTMISACDTYTWSVNGVTYTESGTYTDVDGCATETLVLTITPSTNNTTTISACDTYTWSVNGDTYTQSGTYTDVDGCHTETLVLTIVSSTNNTTTVSACDTYTWNISGLTYTESGTYTSVSGCGTQTLVLTITPSTSNTTTISACDTYTWSVNGATYTESGTYTDVDGCATETLVLTITPSTTNTTTISACDTYTWSVNGATYTQSGTYTDVDGCHTETLVLTIVSSTNNTTTVSACDTYTWSVNGATYTESGTYTDVDGCATETLVLTITPSTNNTTTISACDTYTWNVNGVTYTESGTYVHSVGCANDTLNLSIVPTPTAAFDLGAGTFCTNEQAVLPEVSTPGGLFSSSEGSAVDPISGAIDPASSLPGSYTITYTLDGQCPSSANVNVTIVAAPNADWNSPVSICDNSGSLQLAELAENAGGVWSGSGVTGTTLDPGGLVGPVTITYTMENSGCTASMSHEITVIGAPLSVAGPDTTICGYELLLTGAASSGTGIWSGPVEVLFMDPFAPNTTVIATGAGSYSLVWTVSENGCSSSDTAIVTMRPPADQLNVFAGEDQILEVETTTTLEAITDAGAQVEWTLVGGSALFDAPNSAATIVSGLSLGTNTVMVTVSLGSCTGTSDTLTITVEDLFIPQGFSPNGDGDNDRFEVTGMMAYPNSSFTVFNRWGQKVYENSAYSNEWDGRSAAGTELPDDTYFYVLNLEGDRTYNGFVVIKR